MTMDVQDFTSVRFSATKKAPKRVRVNMAPARIAAAEWLTGAQRTSEAVMPVKLDSPDLAALKASKPRYNLRHIIAERTGEDHTGESLRAAGLALVKEGMLARAKKVEELYSDPKRSKRIKTLGQKRRALEKQQKENKAELTRLKTDQADQGTQIAETTVSIRRAAAATTFTADGASSKASAKAPIVGDGLQREMNRLNAQAEKIAQRLKTTTAKETELKALPVDANRKFINNMHPDELVARETRKLLEKPKELEKLSDNALAHLVGIYAPKKPIPPRETGVTPLDRHFRRFRKDVALIRTMGERGKLEQATIDRQVLSRFHEFNTTILQPRGFKDYEAKQIIHPASEDARYLRSWAQKIERRVTPLTEGSDRVAVIHSEVERLGRGSDPSSSAMTGNDLAQIYRDMKITLSQTVDATPYKVWANKIAERLKANPYAKLPAIAKQEATKLSGMGIHFTHSDLVKFYEAVQSNTLRAEHIDRFKYAFGPKSFGLDTIANDTAQKTSKEKLALTQAAIKKAETDTGLPIQKLYMDHIASALTFPAETLDKVRDTSPKDRLAIVTAEVEALEKKTRIPLRQLGLQRLAVQRLLASTNALHATNLGTGLSPDVNNLFFFNNPVASIQRGIVKANRAARDAKDFTEATPHVDTHQTLTSLLPTIDPALQKLVSRCAPQLRQLQIDAAILKGTANPEADTMIQQRIETLNGKTGLKLTLPVLKALGILPTEDKDYNRVLVNWATGVEARRESTKARLGAEGGRTVTLLAADETELKARGIDVSAVELYELQTEVLRSRVKKQDRRPVHGPEAPTEEQRAEMQAANPPVPEVTATPPAPAVEQPSAGTEQPTASPVDSASTTDTAPAAPAVEVPKAPRSTLPRRIAAFHQRVALLRAACQKHGYDDATTERLVLTLGRDFTQSIPELRSRLTKDFIPSRSEDARNLALWASNMEKQNLGHSTDTESSRLIQQLKGIGQSPNPDPEVNPFASTILDIYRETHDPVTEALRKRRADLAAAMAPTPVTPKPEAVAAEPTPLLVSANGVQQATSNALSTAADAPPATINFDNTLSVPAAAVPTTLAEAVRQEVATTAQAEAILEQRGRGEALPTAETVAISGSATDGRDTAVTVPATEATPAPERGEPSQAQPVHVLAPQTWLNRSNNGAVTTETPPVAPPSELAGAPASAAGPLTTVPALKPKPIPEEPPSAGT